MAGVEPEIAVWRPTDVGDVRWRGRAQTGPERRSGEIASFGKKRLNIIEDRIATLNIEIARIARKLGRAGNTQAIA